MLVRRNEFHPAVFGLRREMDQLFNRFLEPAGFTLQRAQATLAMNIWETNEAVFAEAEVPGFSMTDLEINVNENELAVRGKRSAPEIKDAVIHRREREMLEFNRILRLPVPIDPGTVEAHLKDGVLTVRLPKAAAARPRRIEVKQS